jgi:hypothetical protein
MATPQKTDLPEDEIIKRARLAILRSQELIAKARELVHKTDQLRNDQRYTEKG